MAIGIVESDAFAAELRKLGIVKKESSPVDSVPIIVEKPTRGRDEGDVNVPDSLRQIIGETALLEGRSEAVKLAKDFGISASSASAYAKGATSTTSYNEPKKSITDHINRSRERAVRRASKTLNAAIGAITQEKLDYTDAKDLSGIAKDMSVVIRNLEPQTAAPVNETKSPQFVIFAPQFRREDQFEVINVNE